MGATRLASGKLKQKLTDSTNYAPVYESLPSCPTRDASPPLELAFVGSVWCLRGLYYTTKTLHAEYLTSYTNTLQLIDYKHFT